MCGSAAAVEQMVCVMWSLVACWAGVFDAGVYQAHVGVEVPAEP